MEEGGFFRVNAGNNSIEKRELSDLLVAKNGKIRVQILLSN
jgi:hypothetical protein